MCPISNFGYCSTASSLLWHVASTRCPVCGQKQTEFAIPLSWRKHNAPLRFFVTSSWCNTHSRRASNSLFHRASSRSIKKKPSASRTRSYERFPRNQAPYLLWQFPQIKHADKPVVALNPNPTVSTLRRQWHRHKRQNIKSYTKQSGNISKLDRSACFVACIKDTCGSKKQNERALQL